MIFFFRSQSFGDSLDMHINYLAKNKNVDIDGGGCFYVFLENMKKVYRVYTWWKETQQVSVISPTVYTRGKNLKQTTQKTNRLGDYSHEI